MLGVRGFFWAGALLFCIAVWILLGCAIAHAAPLEIGSYSAKTETTFGATHEVSATETTLVVLMVEVDASTKKLEGGVIKVNGIEVGGFSLVGAGAALKEKQSATVVVPPKGTWEVVKTSECGVCKLYESHASLALAIVEGKEGKEGKEGPPGPEGKEGPPGPEGKEGASGASGKTELESFGEPAQVNLSEMKETIETIGWCIIGTMFACVITFMVYNVLKPSSLRK